MTPDQLRAEHRRLLHELRQLPFLPYDHPDADARREKRRRLNRRLIELEEQMPTGITVRRLR